VVPDHDHAGVIAAAVLAKALYQLFFGLGFGDLREVGYLEGAPRGGVWSV